MSIEIFMEIKKMKGIEKKHYVKNTVFKDKFGCKPKISGIP